MTIKIKAPKQIVATGSRPNFDDWLKLIQSIGRVSIKDDVKEVNEWAVGFRSKVYPTDFKLKITSVTISEYTSKEVESAEVDPKKDKQKLLNLNNEVKTFVTKFEEDAREIANASKKINDLAKSSSEGDKEYYNALKKSLQKVSTLASRHNALMNVPVITHVALSKVANTIKKSGGDSTPTLTEKA